MNVYRRAAALLVSVCLLLSALSVTGFAAAETYGPYEYDSIAQTYPLDDETPRSANMNGIQKAFYNGLNAAADGLLRVFCALYPSPSDWKKTDEWDGAGFLPGRETYAAEAADGNRWRVGYASRSIIPDDFEAGKYYIGRDLTNRLADAVASGSYTDEQLTTVRALNRKGQWYWDFVFVENSDGAHNSSLTKKCLDRAEAFIDAALEILDGLIG